uniref:Uncharacterized protein n=1 Tax=Rhizophora mucronata TaxID=61149 RepID=A0A2P2JJ22_RHIMU
MCKLGVQHVRLKTDRRPHISILDQQHRTTSPKLKLNGGLRQDPSDPSNPSWAYNADSFTLGARDANLTSSSSLSNFAISSSFK